MKSLLINIIAASIVSCAVLYGIVQYLPLSFLEHTEAPKYGTTSITTIQGSDTISGSRTTINNNFASLNTNKVEASDLAGTTTLLHLSVLPALTSIGTIVTGVWNATVITPLFGGTGSSTLSLNQVLLGNTTGNIKTVTGWGTSGQTLISNGALAAPSWQSASFDTSQNYTFTGFNVFLGSTTVSSSTIGTLNFGRLFGTSSLSSFIPNASTTNLTVNGIASTTTLFVSGTCTNCTAATTTSTHTSCGNNSYSDCTSTATCPGSKVVSGGGVQLDVGVTAAATIDYPVGNTTFQGHVLCPGTNCNAVVITTYVMCVNP